MKNRKWLLWITAVVIMGMGCDSASSSDRQTADSGDDDTDADTDKSWGNESDPDVCGFRDPVSLGDSDENGMVAVPPNHPAIRYFGRVDCSDPQGPAFAFPGVAIRVGFEGTRIDMVLDDNGSTSAPNFYNVIVDGNAPVVLEMRRGENTYTLASDLEDAHHIVEVFKRVESNGNLGRGVFLGFAIESGATLHPPQVRPHRLEVIGDSISCGYGNELSVENPNSYHYTTENSNAYNAWSAIAARDLNAEYMAVAYSGRGVYRNYGGGGGETLPEMYLDTLPDDAASAEWEVDRFTPEVLVINLGTNDFSTGLDADTISDTTETYELAMLAFVETLRGYYSDTAIFLAVGPMLSDGYPEGYEALTNVTTALEAVITSRRTEGDENVHLLTLSPQSPPYGEDWHPTVATHMDMAGELADLVDELNLM